MLLRSCCQYRVLQRFNRSVLATLKPVLSPCGHHVLEEFKVLVWVVMYDKTMAGKSGGRRRDISCLNRLCSGWHMETKARLVSWCVVG